MAHGKWSIPRRQRVSKIQIHLPIHFSHRQIFVLVEVAANAQFALGIQFAFAPVTIKSGTIVIRNCRAYGFVREEFRK